MASKLPSPLLSLLSLVFLLLVCPASASVPQTINGTVYNFDFCEQLTFGPLCWLTNTANASITISYSYNWDGYVAVAFSPDGSMVGSSAVIGWTSPSPFISNFNLVSKNDGGNAPGAATLGLTSALVTTDTSGLNTLLFTRPLVNPTNPAYTIAQQAGGSNFVLESHGPTPSNPNSVAFHGDGNMASNTVAFTTGAVVALGDPLLNWKHAHASLMTIAFGGLVPLGIIFARFFKGWGPIWFHLHRVLVLTALALIIAGFAIGINKIGTGYYTTHRGIGIYVVAAMLFQPLNAIVRPHPPGPGEKPTHLRAAWQALHHWNARIAYVFAIGTQPPPTPQLTALLSQH